MLRYFLRSCSNDVRVRFAPSPTGKMHLGSLRTALFNYLFAKHHKGQFILRLEDTDQTRLVPGCGEEFEKILSDFGLNVDESPLKGGNFGSYKQSERINLYKEKSEELIQRGHAYHCFCTPERLNILRKNAERLNAPVRYDGKCRNLSKEEISQRFKNGEKSVIRFKYEDREMSFNDIVYGLITQKTGEGDFIIMKSDNFPTYHFANVVDDNHMKISHVIRGMEWISSTGKHLQLYNSLDITPPIWIHLPLITRNGEKKLSKRDKDAFVEYYTKDKGYLTLGILNFLIRNGSGIRNHSITKLYQISDMIKDFDHNMIGRRNFMLDKNSLEYFGRLSFREANFDTQLYPEIANRIGKNIDKEYVRRVVDFLKENEESFSKLSLLDKDASFGFFFSKTTNLDNLKSHFDTNIIKKMLLEILSLDDINNEKLREISHNNDMKYAKFFKMIRLSLIDSINGPPISELITFFGEKEIKNRLQNVILLINQEK
ncbi:Probable glutamate--tRNA ligase, mitochondrial [Strongyloides ratti]|uniref:Nondiscriminating glutamyl-tRNA synthetase EARS2, mitochondrial n=1 Tax=Strongyloides ratti TaxID=34506 RepID=A0A090LN27_STRRB|nr:Probable glutamate--tRNA ligase, mitochondrial [Strongyloides ratti]CEF68940.1 Probable glutamate--tRNA ligase, mitochondrial [Strongyloides ratti]